MSYYTTRQAAEAVGHSPKTLRKELLEGRLHGFQRGVAKHYRIDPDCLQAWVQGNRCKHGKR